jgi:hypothetical protein
MVKYQMAADKDFQSDTEQRFWVTLSFREQGVNERRVQLSLKVDTEGRWLIAPVPD